ncbi:kinase [Thalassotalea insulae]|uniref:Kinase n=1 Tax=Thalassotalea insulae TaxID=2056778 RepID=A0ABQ6GQR6_9GAMM|nr:kinase [Thalassotalea insulae]GLX78236.1 kinase [Thalassotalea insulae]
MFNDFIRRHQLSASFATVAEQYYLPLAHRITQQVEHCQQPYFVAINGCQGSGKSTLADYLASYLREQCQLNVAVLSLDDFYLSSEQRKQLALKVHPLFATRGVPGTHNVQLLQQVLNKLKQGETNFCLPRFNKATDEPEHITNWSYISEPADLVIVEGWCLGAVSVEPSSLHLPVNELEQKQDPKARWRSYSNEVLACDYQPLYSLFDYWLLLKAPSFTCVYQWRLEQEQKLARQNKLAEHKIMSEAEIGHFIQHFQRLTMTCLQQLPTKVDCQMLLNSERDIERVIYKTSS